MTTQMEVTAPQSVAQAQAEVDRLHRSGAMTLISLAAFWGIAASLYEWGSPLAGQIALLIGSAAAHPVAWLVLKLAGGPAMVPRSNPLAGLFYQVCAIPLVGTLGAMALADERPDAFFASAMLGLAASFLPSATLYGRTLYLGLAAVFVVLPVVAWIAAEPLLPWFGLLGVALLLVAGALLLRRLGGLGAAPHPGQGASALPPLTGTAGAGAAGDKHDDAALPASEDYTTGPFDAEADNAAPATAGPAAGEAKAADAVEHLPGEQATPLDPAADADAWDNSDAVITDRDTPYRPEA